MTPFPFSSQREERGQQHRRYSYLYLATNSAVIFDDRLAEKGFIHAGLHFTSHFFIGFSLSVLAFAQTPGRSTSELQAAATPSTDTTWRKHAVLYEIYRRTFQDPNGDGMASSVASPSTSTICKTSELMPFGSRRCRLIGVGGRLLAALPRFGSSQRWIKAIQRRSLV
jgi:hypothetical protein